MTGVNVAGVFVVMVLLPWGGGITPCLSIHIAVCLLDKGLMNTLESSSSPTAQAKQTGTSELLEDGVAPLSLMTEVV